MGAVRITKKKKDGRVFSAQQAVDLKLVDRIGCIGRALGLTRKRIGAEQLKVVVYIPPSEDAALYCTPSSVSGNAAARTMQAVAERSAHGPPGRQTRVDDATNTCSDRAPTGDHVQGVGRALTDD